MLFGSLLGVILLSADLSWSYIFNKESPVLRDADSAVTTTISSTSSGSSEATADVPDTSFTCPHPGKFRGPLCPLYYECVLVSTLRICGENENFDSDSQTCRSAQEVICSDCSTSTTTQPTFVPVEPPACPGPGNYPTSYCENYYECTSVWWWFEPRLQTCAYGTLYDVNLAYCADAASVDCTGRTHL